MFWRAWSSRSAGSSRRGKCCSIHFRARIRNSERSSSPSAAKVCSLFEKAAQPDLVLLGCSKQGAVDGYSPRVEMNVVLPSHSDPAADLHALVDDVETTVGDVCLGDTGQSG